MATLRDILIICPLLMHAPLPNDFATFLHRKEVAVWMMSCGALVSSTNSYTKLAAQVQQQVTALVLVDEAGSTYSFFRLHVSDLIAFTTAQLQPCLTVGFIQAYSQQVLVEKFNVLSFM